MELKEEPKIDLLLLTGYLGAGKTTLLNRLLKTPPVSRRRTVLLVNEFGPISVDGARVEAEEETVFELNRGSLFCICIKTDFLKTFDAIRQIQPELVLVEATGVAETSDIVNLLRETEHTEAFRLKANVCVVDARNVTKVLPFLRAAVTQIESADVLLINKSDLLDEQGLAKLGDLLASINPHAAQRAVSYGDVPDDFVETLQRLPRDRRELLVYHPPPNITAISFDATKANREILLQVIRDLDDRLPRFKGFLDFGDGTTFIESVFGTVFEEPLPRGKAGKGRVGKGCTAIGWNIRKDALLEAFEGVFE